MYFDRNGLWTSKKLERNGQRGCRAMIYFAVMLRQEKKREVIFIHVELCWDLRFHDVEVGRRY